MLSGSSDRKCPCHLLDLVSDFCVLLQVALVCHGMTEVVPDKDGSDPYEVKYQVLCQHVIEPGSGCVPGLRRCIAEEPTWVWLWQLFVHP